jgi:acyl carrier protein
MADVRVTLQEVFRDVFDEPDLEISDNMDSGSVANWDSLRHINMIIATEKALGIRLSTSEISRLKRPGQTVGSFIELLEKKLAEAR